MQHCIEVNWCVCCLYIQESELIISIPRSVMITSDTAKASVLGMLDYLKYIWLFGRASVWYIQYLTSPWGSTVAGLYEYRIISDFQLRVCSMVLTGKAVSGGICHIPTSHDLCQHILTSVIINKQGICLDVKIKAHSRLFNLFLCLKIVSNMRFFNQFLLKPLGLLS